MQKTLVIIKPDAVQRRLIGKIINRFEEKGLEIIGLKITVISKELAKEHYSVHDGKDYYKKLIEFMISGPAVMMVLRGKKAIEVTRKLMGSTFGHEAAPGTIRGDFAMSKRCNLLHSSDSEESAEREISLFFENEDLIQNDQSCLKWIYDLPGSPTDEDSF